MKQIPEHKDSFKVIGIEIRTNNKRADAEMSELWHKFIAENYFDKIPNKKHLDIIALYSGYQGDATKSCFDYTEDSYNYLIGYEVENLDTIPVGLTGHEVPAADYAKITISGDFPESLVNAWKQIWKSDLKRTHRYDFEVYGAGFQGPEKIVDIYIGVEA